MKKLVVIYMLLISCIFGKTQKVIDQSSIYNKVLIKLNLKKDYSNSFTYKSFQAYSKKQGGHRKIKGRIKNISNRNFRWVSFKVYIGEGNQNFHEVFFLTINDFKKGKTYLFNENVDATGIKGKKVAISYISSSAEKQ